MGGWAQTRQFGQILYRNNKYLFLFYNFWRYILWNITVIFHNSAELQKITYSFTSTVTAFTKLLVINVEAVACLIPNILAYNNCDHIIRLIYFNIKSKQPQNLEKYKIKFENTVFFDFFCTTTSSSSSLLSPETRQA